MAGWRIAATRSRLPWTRRPLCGFRPADGSIELFGTGDSGIPCSTTTAAITNPVRPNPQPRSPWLRLARHNGRRIHKYIVGTGISRSDTQEAEGTCSKRESDTVLPEIGDQLDPLGNTQIQDVLACTLRTSFTPGLARGKTRAARLARLRFPGASPDR